MNLAPGNEKNGLNQIWSGSQEYLTSSTQLLQTFLPKFPSQVYTRFPFFFLERLSQLFLSTPWQWKQYF